MIAAALCLGTPPDTTSAAGASAARMFPAAGAYATQGASTIISDDGRLQVSWIGSQVFPWEGGIPTRWQVDVIYHNTSDHVLYLTCKGWDTGKVREYISRGGRNIGHVEAEHDLCSDHPDWNANLSPNHRLVLSWAVFHNVPRIGDQVSLQWGTYGTSKALDPFGH
ncbi:hypothetical protein [Streptomyces griseus]|uniref:hypothetical protein n=1 Tax=Streptomyces griseus TaxID=1911 RepID=UPI00131C0956|nr:hypothetical protein [Streptomyces griseus]